ncbi:MAG TPA: DinB family protein, partial [Chryseolinea sp.]|nr:DinB family protein [Chryseolinea sp.]
MKTQLLSTIENLLSTIENSRGYTLAVAEAMPEDRYDFRPTSAVWNFLELMNHIVYGINWYNENYIQKTKTPWEPPAPHKTKAATIKSLEQSFVALEKVLNSVD